MSTNQPALRVDQLSVSYGSAQVINQLDLVVEAGEIVALLGANGVGKTTVLRAICGVIPASAGRVSVDGRDVLGWPTHRISECGVRLVPDGRGTLASLTVEDNLLVGAYTLGRRASRRALDDWYEEFPILGTYRSRRAGFLSGGEQQMLAIARSMISNPDVLLLDEPSLGLAPAIAQQVIAKLRTACDKRGTAVLLVEQNASLALTVASRGHLLTRGGLGASSPAAELRDDPLVRAAYLDTARSRS